LLLSLLLAVLRNEGDAILHRFVRCIACSRSDRLACLGSRPWLALGKAKVNDDRSFDEIGRSQVNRFKRTSKAGKPITSVFSLPSTTFGNGDSERVHNFLVPFTSSLLKSLTFVLSQCSCSDDACFFSLFVSSSRSCPSTWTVAVFSAND
jgi:hypothetical protein